VRRSHSELEETTVDANGGPTTTVRASRRPAYLAVTAVVAVAAILLALLARDDGPPVIRLGAAGTEAAMESDAAEMSIGRAYPAEYRFLLTDAARFPAGEGQAWRLDPPSDLRAATSELAEALGLAGQPVTSPYDGGWQVGPDDGSGPTIWVSPSGDWGFHDASWMPEVRCVEPHLIDPVDPDEPVSSEPLPVEPDEGIGDAGEPATVEGKAGDGVTGSSGDAAAEEPVEIDELPACEPVEPPAGIPDEAEARRAAESFFARLGLPATPRITEVHRDEWGAWVSATVPLGSQASDLYVSVGLGPDAVVTSASGTLAQAVELDRYPTIDADAAVERLQGQHAWQGGRMEVLVDPELPVEGAVEDDVVTILPAPGPEGEPEVVTVTLVAAEPLAMLTYDVDGTSWLLPGVRFTDADGGHWQVMTVDDEYVDTGAAPAPEPEPTTEPGTEEPGGAVEPGDEGSGGSSTPVEEPRPEPLPGGPGEAETLAHDVIGRSEADAVAAIEEAGYVARIVSRDGEDFAVTDDHRTDRINLRIGAGVVTHADVG
jgi:hypothetical protein